MDEPANDAQFVGFFADPTLPRVLNALTGGVLAIPAPPRFDLRPLVQYVPPIAAAGTLAWPGCRPAAPEHRRAADAAGLGQPTGGAGRRQRRIPERPPRLRRRRRHRAASRGRRGARGAVSRLQRQRQRASGRRRQRERRAVPGELPLRRPLAERARSTAHRPHRARMHGRRLAHRARRNDRWTSRWRGAGSGRRPAAVPEVRDAETCCRGARNDRVRSRSAGRGAAAGIHGARPAVRAGGGAARRRAPRPSSGSQPRERRWRTSRRARARGTTWRWRWRDGRAKPPIPRTTRKPGRPLNGR